MRHGVDDAQEFATLFALLCGSLWPHSVRYGTSDLSGTQQQNVDSARVNIFDSKFVSLSDQLR